MPVYLYIIDKSQSIDKPSLVDSAILLSRSKQSIMAMIPTYLVLPKGGIKTKGKLNYIRLSSYQFQLCISYGLRVVSSEYISSLFAIDRAKFCPNQGVFGFAE